MRKKSVIYLVVAFMLCSISSVAQLKMGAERTADYLPMLANKRVALVVNPSSTLGDGLLVDSLYALGVNIVKVFGPEHGFRGSVGAGVKVGDEVDAKTGIPIVSLYGKSNKPSARVLADVDLVLFDIQDIGVRYFTYMSTLHRVMEACAENNKMMLVLDRPNPNGHYTDGNILDMHYTSDIGKHPVPIVHGMTVGEYAQMINGEGWLAQGLRVPLKVIAMEGYTHDTPYLPPVRMSPNINTAQAVYLYPSTCLFEGTILSEGRGTMFPFTVLGAPHYKGIYSFSFVPEVIVGMSATPIYKGETCFGIDLRQVDLQQLRQRQAIDLSYLLEAYKNFPNKKIFFDRHQSKEIVDFVKLAGGPTLQQQIEAGMSEAQIRQSWQPGLEAFKVMRKPYLLYP